MNGPRSNQRTWRWRSIPIAVVAGWLFLQAPRVLGEPAAYLWRFGFSSRAFIGINEHDARASTRVWAQTIGREKKLRVDPEARTYRSVAEINRALGGGDVDMVVLSTPEYFELDASVQSEDIISQAGIEGEEYLLLAAAAGGITNPVGVCGRTLNVQDGFRSSLALPWLDTLLLEAGRAPSAESVGKIQLALKPSQAMLPVFFGKADACLVSQSAFDTMTEMNPQISQRLRIVARSPKFLSAFLVMRRDLDAENKRILADAMSALHKSPSGAQILALFQGQPLARMSPSVLDTARAMLVRREQLLQAWKPAPVAVVPDPSP